jgi:hypothetical protein
MARKAAFREDRHPGRRARVRHGVHLQRVHVGRQDPDRGERGDRRHRGPARDHAPGEAAGPDPRVNRVRSVWAHRTASEYRSAARAAEYAHWLLRLAAPPDLVRAALRTAREELDHAEACHDHHRAAGGTFEQSPVPEGWLSLEHAREAPLALRALAVACDEYAIAETVALALFRTLARGPLRPEVAAVVRRIVADEGRHSAFGWAAVDALLDTPGGRELVVDGLPRWTARVRRAYASDAPPCSPEETAWGLLSPAVYEGVVERTLARVRVRFERLLSSAACPGPPAASERGVRPLAGGNVDSGPDPRGAEPG